MARLGTLGAGRGEASGTRVAAADSRPGSWLMAEAAVDGEFSLESLGLKNPTVPTAYTTFTYINSIAAGGQSRKEMVEVLSAVTKRRGMGRFLGRRGGSSYEGGFN